MKYLNKVFLLAACSMLWSCNSDQLPNDTRVSVSPSGKNIRISSTFEEDMFCFIEDGLYQDVPLLISVTDGQSAPLGDVEVGVYADYAANSFNGAEVIQLYSDANGNGVIDGPEELVTSVSSGIYKAKTDKYNGTTMLMLRMYLTCPYDGEVFVYAGSASASMSVGVTYSTTTETETTSGETDTGTEDAGETDTGSTDAGTGDAGNTDSGTVDVGNIDAGLTDAGNSDFGVLDAGNVDAGLTDAGNTDFGVLDAGNIDAGLTDAGNSDFGALDAGSIDAGLTDVGGSDEGSLNNGITDTGTAEAVSAVPFGASSGGASE